MQVIVHGGAGGAPAEPESRQAVLDEAARTGAASSDPVDAVEQAVRVLESSPRFNAGVGGSVQSDGVIRTDAGLMRSDREAGAACSMPGVEHAVSAARAVMEETPHVLVSGTHAVELAAEFGVETAVDLWTERTQERWTAIEDRPADPSPRAHLAWIREKFGRSERRRSPAGSSAERQSAERSNGSYRRDHDTVGAVARDGDAFAAATSTGGRWLALAGRVGDVPQIGNGFYCAPAGGASTTGAGEDIAKATLARRAVRHLESGDTAQAAADRAIAEFGELTGSNAGVVLLDADGNAGGSFNSDAMQTAVARE